MSTIEFSNDGGDSWEEVEVEGLSIESNSYDADPPSDLPDDLYSGQTVTWTGTIQSIGCAPIPGWPGWSVLKRTWFDWWPLSAQRNVVVR